MFVSVLCRISRPTSTALKCTGLTDWRSDHGTACQLIRSSPSDLRAGPFIWAFVMRGGGCWLRGPEAVADAEQLEGLPLKSGRSGEKPEAGQRRVGRGDGVQADGAQVGQQGGQAVHGQVVGGLLGGGLGHGAG